MSLALSLSAFSLANLIVLSMTRRFERYVVALVSSGCIFVPIATWLSGGLTLASSGLVWGFLIPAYALLALGPAKGARWYAAFIGVVVLPWCLSSGFRSQWASLPTWSS